MSSRNIRWHFTSLAEPPPAYIAAPGTNQASSSSQPPGYTSGPLFSNYRPDGKQRPESESGESQPQIQGDRGSLDVEGGSLEGRLSHEQHDWLPPQPRPTRWEQMSFNEKCGEILKCLIEQHERCRQKPPVPHKPRSQMSPAEKWADTLHLIILSIIFFGITAGIIYAGVVGERAARRAYYASQTAS